MQEEEYEHHSGAPSGTFTDPSVASLPDVPLFEMPGMDEDANEAFAAGVEADINAFWAGQPIFSATRGGGNSRDSLQAREVVRPNYDTVHQLHLLQADNNVQPVMGAVHMVRPPGKVHDKHFMHDVHGDINEGQRVLKERSRRGPFRDQKGPSTVMDSSAHITYRKRGGVFEIVIKRGVSNVELQQLLSKLSMHRLSIQGSNVVVIKGRKRFRLGSLSRLDLRKLLRVIEDCLQNY